MHAQDILTATHKLEDAGMSRSESEAVASIIATAVAPLATKADLEAHKRATKADFEEFKQEVRADMGEFKQEVRGMFRDFKVENAATLQALKDDLKNDLKNDLRDGFRSELRSEINRVETRLEDFMKQAATKKDIVSIKLWFIMGWLSMMSVAWYF